MKITARGLALLGTAIAVPATAQNLSYGADNFYHSPNVTIHPVTFPTQNDLLIAGNLFLPPSSNHTIQTDSSFPAIVVGHPMGAVKEQSANLYATKLSEQGFVTVSLDLPFWGGSAGEPRNAVVPDFYAEAFSAAVDYLGTQDIVAVDRDHIGALGICGSGGFVLSAAKIDSRIRAVATASMYDMGGMARSGLRGSVSLEARRQSVISASEQRWNEFDGGEIQYTSGTPEVLTTNSSAIDREFYDFYRTSRGAFVPAGSSWNLTTHPTLSSNIKFLNFYPFNDLETISPRPVLFISGDQAHSREFSEEAYNRAAEPKELFWVPGAGHVDLYDRVGLIPWRKLVGFFRTNLA
ncbi:alpha/beta hydrolase [Aspergillus undulatus]|uniref:alpha/beta hydrolase n=1 Tax=Aspergillus undulatus TaxID=1810928 RepID=UPI003CCDA568